MALPAPKPAIDTCHACGKLFPRLGIRLCSGCAPIEQHRFELVREFVLENDGAAVADIAGATGVSAADVRNFMEGGRLVQLAGTACTCRGVGERCRHCRSRLSASFRDMESAMQRERAQRPTADDGESRTTYVRRIRRLGDQA